MRVESEWGFNEIREIGLDSPLADYPFTHNRPEETDVCLLARRKAHE
jgi:hypothetical protein